MSLFDLDEGGKELHTSFKPENASASQKIKLKKANKDLLRKEEAKEIISSIGGIPKKEESFDIITNGQSNAGGFYEVIRDEWKGVDCLCVATWIINRHYIDELEKDLKSGMLKKLVFIISNRMSQLGKTHAPNFNRLKTICIEHKDKVSFRVVNSHAKTYAMTNGTDYITVDGSGNWSKNPRIENYTLSNSKTKFDFRLKWMMELCNAK